jgi:beta-glucosidase
MTRWASDVLWEKRARTEIGGEVYPVVSMTSSRASRRTASLPSKLPKTAAPIAITADAGGRVADNRHILYYREHLRELARAIGDGADVRGHHAWSILDNFEWAEGYTQRFGLVYIDFPTRRRYVKDSASRFRKSLQPTPYGHGRSHHNESRTAWRVRDINLG